MTTTTVTTRKCMFCGEASRVELTADQATLDRTGTPIQDVLPDVPADQRELLISGTHPACWAGAFG